MGLDIKRLDHLGIIAGVIKDLGLVEAIDERLKKDNQEQEKITAGEAVAGMIMNGLGFSGKPLSLTPHFFETKALDCLFRPGVKAEYFNRHKLGKVLDAVHTYGSERLFFELSSQSRMREQIEVKFNSIDTTSLSLTGEYNKDTDENTIKITQGYSKDHRQDLKQVVQALLVSQDGGVPLMMKSWDGNASDNKIFKERARLLIEHFKKSEWPRYLIADSKLYYEDNAINLQQLKFITRIPRTLQEERNCITASLREAKWERLDDKNKYCVKQVTHYGLVQRWIVVHSENARERAKKTLDKAIKKEGKAIEKKLWHLSKQAYDCSNDAQKAAETLIRQCRYHQCFSKTMTEKKGYKKLGRPQRGEVATTLHYGITATVIRDEASIQAQWDEKSCYVIGTNTDEKEINSPDVIAAYKRQNSSIENMGFRFLKDPIFFVSSLFLKKNSRIMGLLMVMTLALLVYSIAQRRLRTALKNTGQTLPNQIKQPTNMPTMRWIFQLMEGIHVVKMKVGALFRTVVHGLNDLKIKIISLMGNTIRMIYSIEKNTDPTIGGSSM